MLTICSYIYTMFILNMFDILVELLYFNLPKYVMRISQAARLVLKAGKVLLYFSKILKLDYTFKFVHLLFCLY